MLYCCAGGDSVNEQTIQFDAQTAARIFAEAAEAMIPIAQQVWATITKIVREFIATFQRWFDGLPPAIRRAFVGRSETMMRKKVRRYALWCARRQ